MDFRKKKEINNGTVLQNREKRILSKVVPHEIKKGKLIKTQN